MVVAGGGSGGGANSSGGGGGAGGYRASGYRTKSTTRHQHKNLSLGTYAVTVGAGGAGHPGSEPS